ncbi:MAG: OmpA family protein, partial [Bacteroidota bacterium]
QSPVTGSAVPAAKRKRSNGKMGRVAPVSSVGFAAGTAEPVTGDWAEVDELAEVLRAHPGLVVEIAGHLGAEGTEADRLRLTNERTALVKLRLLELGVAASQITVDTGRSSPPRERPHPGNDWSCDWSNAEATLVRVEQKMIGGILS